jgi:hypothetical protein
MVEIDWNIENTQVLCKLFAEQVGSGNRPNIYLNSVGYDEVEKGLKDRLGIVATKTQMKNKWDKLKADFKAWNKLFMRQTETGWCPIKSTIVMDDNWWKNVRKVSVELWFCFIIVYFFYSQVYMLFFLGHSRMWEIQETRPHNLFPNLYLLRRNNR